MAIAHDFLYERPACLKDALELLHEHGTGAKILAGGTDLIVNIKEGMLKPTILIDIKDIAELKGIVQKDETLFLGALVTFEDLIESPLVKELLPMLHDAAMTVASSGVRSRASLAGNICSAVPSLDSAPPLLCHEATVHCESLSGKRAIPIAEWFVAPRKTALRADEILTGISIPMPKPGTAGIYLKLGRYNGEDLAQAGWGIWLDMERNYRIAHCALGPVPARAHRVEAILKGQALSEEILSEAAKAVESEISPITDIRASKEYRIHVSGVMLRRGLLAVTQRQQGIATEAKKLLGGLA